VTILGRRYKFLPHLGFICFPFDFINLQVHKPASADLLSSQITRNWREIHLGFSSRTFDTGVRVFHPTGAHRVRMHFLLQFCQRAGAICTSVHIVGRAFELKFDIVSSWMWGKLIFLLKNDDMHALNTAPLRPLNL
jgi:hypothetical protein